jgi:hypothetical protein
MFLMYCVVQIMSIHHTTARKEALTISFIYNDYRVPLFYYSVCDAVSSEAIIKAA